MTFKHYTLWFLFIITLCALAGVFWIGIWLLWPYKAPLVIKNFGYNNPIHIETPVIHPGDSLKYKLDYCKYGDYPAIVYRTLVDGQTITLVPTESNAPAGCREVTSISSIVPETVNPGRYYLDVVIEYKINPFRTERVHFFTDYFEVVRKSMPSTSEPPEINSTKVIPIVPPVSVSAR